MEPKTYLYNGGYLTIKQLAELSEVSGATIRQRILSDWTISEAVETPSGASAYPTKTTVSKENNRAVIETNRKIIASRGFARCAARINAK